MKARAMIPFYDFNGKKLEDMQEVEKLDLGHSEAIKHCLSSDLNHYYRNLKDLRAFLIECQYVQDINEFNLEDYWMIPVHFENKRKGDCEDFALYTWKQLLHMGINSRFVLGTAGKGKGHAWCTAVIKGKKYIVDPLMARAPFLPVFTFGRYKPVLSVAAEGENPVYFKHYALNETGDKIFDVFLVLRGVLLYPVIVLSFILAIVPLFIIARIKVALIRRKRKWT